MSRCRGSSRPHDLLWSVLLSSQAHRQRHAGGHQGGHDDLHLHHPPERHHGCVPGGLLFQARLSSVRHLQWRLQESLQPPVRLGLRRVGSGSPAGQWERQAHQEVLHDSQGQEDRHFLS